ncbi:MAG: glycosyltransferase family 39 protein, partial [Candidatus Roizmanbacteria bacterium]|nr:glycosyltransferase family 39 protein [Candidatus Roizmanbacteria bacterium]
MKKHIPFFIVLFVFLSLQLFKVISDVRPFFDWDEGIYAQVGREMIQAKSYLVPLWQGKAWLDKPPLPPLVYGIVGMLPVQPEISMRIVSVLLSGLVIGLLYAFAFRFSGSVLVSLASVIITSYLGPYLQRTQVLNVDVFLLIGWLGYVLFYRQLYVGMFFLLVGVLSKSLLGYFPVLMILFFETYEFFTHKKKKFKNEYFHFLQVLFFQVAVSLLWFIWMYIQYKDAFIQYHIIDSHFKRVTSSIEQHFGQRTFYIDIIVEQFKWFLIPAGASLLVLTYEFFIKKRKEAFFAVLFFPWFIFLNLTKTKIAWYIYPVLPQFAFLTVYLIRYIPKNWFRIGVTCAILFYFFKTITPIDSYLTTHYSQVEDHQLIAQDAKKVGCTDIAVLVSSNTRTSYKTLKSMDLVIHTTTWWGDHPVMAYYADMPTKYYYTVEEFEKQI